MMFRNYIGDGACIFKNIGDTATTQTIVGETRFKPQTWHYYGSCNGQQMKTPVHVAAK